MKISIVYITKRPGGYDILFNSLNQQLYQNYELIIVDDIIDDRKELIENYAKEKNIFDKIVYLGKSKEKTFPDTKFNISNALNTGYIQTTGDIVLTLMDYAWIPTNLLMSINIFYNKYPNNLLAFREIFYETKDVDKNKLFDNKTITIFEKEIDEEPKNNYNIILKVNPKLDRRSEKSNYVPFNYWELFCSAIPRDILVKLNGIDEKLDYGDDFHEKNISLRARELGCKIFLDVKNVVQQVEHRNLCEEENETWNRFAKDTNIRVGHKLIKESGIRIKHNNFSLE